MRGTVRLLAALVLGGGVLVGTAATPAAAADKNCRDFGSQAAAQAYLRFDPSDPSGLDGNDDDGIACESLPGPFDRDPVRASSISTTGGVSSSDAAAAVLPAVAAADDKDCGDFATQAAAQAHLAADPSDPDNLDADNDGQACEGTFAATAASSSAASSARAVPASARSAPAALARSGPPGTRTLLVAGIGLILVGAALVGGSRRTAVAPPPWVVLGRVLEPR